MLQKFYRIQSEDRTVNMIQSALEKVLNPVFDNPLMDGQVLQSVSLTTGTNLVNHKLGRKLLGWFIVRQRSAASIYDNQDNNLMQELNLKLISSADVIVDLYCF